MRRNFAAALLVVAGGVAVGCGAEDKVNEPRPPSPIELTARIDNSRVVVSPDEVGAGLANLTISNQSDEDVELELVGPNDRGIAPINAGGVATVKLELTQGDYSIDSSVSSIDPGTLTVGAERPSAQNDLLLP